MRSQEAISLSGSSCDTVWVGLAAFALYLWTICPTVYVGDSGELTAAAHCLGIPHNSGYPLYALIGKIFCLIPFGNIGFRVNLMSAAFVALAVAILHGLVLRIAASRVASLAAALFLAFTPLFWLQAVSAEVYSLHIFFVAAIVRLLWRWDQYREPRRLWLLAFVSGLSFCNHMQTLMLAPAVLSLILIRDWRSFLRPGNLAVLSLIFSLSLTIYLYLPLRTEAGAAITWGDPDTLDRFLAHVTARAHRSGYVLNKGIWEYLGRALEGSAFVGVEFGFLLLFAVWGWLRGLRPEWRLFCLLVIVFDFVYTVFLNTISLEITAFGLVTAFVLALLCGLGISDILNRVRESGRVGPALKSAVGCAFCLLPLPSMIFHFGTCDQSRNYTAYEHAVNILRTTGSGSLLLADGDNNVFPLVYARVCEGMGESVEIFDRLNLIFRWPPREGGGGQGVPMRKALEEMLRENPERPVYLCAHDPQSFPLPGGFPLVPYGVLMRVQGTGPPIRMDDIRRLWAGYSTASFYEPMERDYMNRQVCGFFHYHLATYFFQSGLRERGMEAARWASRIGYNDQVLHSDVGICLTRNGLFEDGLRELNLALRYAEKKGMAHNNLGYHFDVTGDYERAVASLRMAVELEPHNHVYLTNLGLALLKSGSQEEAIATLRKSLEVEGDQPNVKAIVEGNGHPF